jgi:hypothetical protein
MIPAASCFSNCHRWWIGPYIVVEFSLFTVIAADRINRWIIKRP